MENYRVHHTSRLDDTTGRNNRRIIDKKRRPNNLQRKEAPEQLGPSRMVGLYWRPTNHEKCNELFRTRFCVFLWDGTSICDLLNIVSTSQSEKVHKLKGQKQSLLTGFVSSAGHREGVCFGAFKLCCFDMESNSSSNVGGNCFC